MCDHGSGWLSLPFFSRYKDKNPSNFISIYAVAKNALGVMPVVCKWQMFLSSELCFTDDTVTDLDTLVSCMEEKFSDDCHDAICDEMSDTGAPCPGAGVGNLKHPSTVLKK